MPGAQFRIGNSAWMTNEAGLESAYTVVFWGTLSSQRSSEQVKMDAATGAVPGEVAEPRFFGPRVAETPSTIRPYAWRMELSSHLRPSWEE